MEHNDYDYNCIKWYGDRSPARNRSWKSNLIPGRGVVWKPVPLIHREMNGEPVMGTNHRCLICNPYNEQEQLDALGYNDEVL